MIGVGEQVGGYTLLAQIGRGTTGDVFLAKHRVLGRQAAIKLLAPPLSKPGPALDRFFADVKGTVRLRHPGIVDVLNFGTGPEGRAFIVMELLDGESLAAYLKRAGSRAGDLAFVVGMGIAVAEAVGAAHGAGIFHEALSPASIFLHLPGDEALDRPGARAVTVKVLGFGVGVGVGVAKEARARSDIYSLGCVLYEALCGAPPFVRDTVGDLEAAVLSQEPEPLSARLPALPPAVGDFVLELLRPAAEARPQTMNEVAAGLRRCAGALGVALDRVLSPRLPVEGRSAGAAESTGRYAMTPPTSTAAPRPVHFDDNVQFTVRRPKVAAPDRWHKLLVFAHLSEKRPDAPPDEPDPLDEVERQAGQLLGADASDHAATTTDSDSAIPEAGELTFVPIVPGIEFNPRRIAFRWVKPVHGFSFDFRAPAALDYHTARGAVHVFLGNVIVAEISVAIAVDGARADAARAQDQGRPYRKIFASYSHKDLRVVEEFRTYAQALGDRYVLDCVDLRAGEVWSDAIAKLIRDADVFQLFWSRNSMHSPYVRQEWEFALSLGEQHRIRPTYWEDPLPEAPGLPPEALKRLHFQRIVARSEAAGPPAAAAKGNPEAPAATEAEPPRPPAAQVASPVATAGASVPTTLGYSALPPAPSRTSGNRARNIATGAVASMVVVMLMAFVVGQRASKPPRDFSATSPAPPVASPIPLEMIRIEVTGLPSDAVVTVDGRVVPSLPIVLPKGPHKHLVVVHTTGTLGTREALVDATHDQGISFEPTIAPTTPTTPQEAQPKTFNYAKRKTQHEKSNAKAVTDY